MRILGLGLVLLQVFSLSCRAGGEEKKPYRVLAELDLRVFGCSPNPSFYLFSSQAELKQAMGEFARHCRPSDFQELEAEFLSSLAAAGIQWQEESLVVLGEWYGTGMAKAHLEFALSQPGVLDASIVWRVPPPPLTPDTAVFRGGFLVTKSMVAKIRVRGKDRKAAIMSVGR